MKTRCYAILARNKATGEFQGRVENSFSMGWSDTHVRLYRCGRIIKCWHCGKSMKRDQQCSKYSNKTAIQCMTSQDPNTYFEDAKYLQKNNSDKFDVFVTRIGSKNCPIRIDWTEYYDIIRSGERLRNHEYRNLPFSVK